MKTNVVYNMDCLDKFKDIPDNSINLIVTDPPYNIGKAEWDKIDNYIEWCSEWISECERVLKYTGSFYFFHNEFDSLVKLYLLIKENTQFKFKQFISWDKWNNKIEKGNNLQGAFYKIVHNPGLKNYPKMSEYILFYTFQEGTGLDNIKKDVNNFTTLRNYFEGLQEYIGLSLSKINKTLGHRKAEHCFYWNSTQWDLPTKETYQELIKEFNINKYKEYQTYNELEKEYQKLRESYESLRYTFKNTNNITSIWQHPIPNKKERIKHPTQKPVELIENIIKHSSNKGDIVLDCFAGSGTTGVACQNTNRDYILIEQDEEYCNIINDRLKRGD